MSDAWISPWWQAVVLPPWNVCGVSVPSLTVWHTFALENIGNGYLCGGPCFKDDAASLLIFASHDFAGGRRIVLDDRYRYKQKKKMYRRLRKLAPEYIGRACQEYVESCTRTASRYKSGPNSRSASVPFQWHVVQLMSRGDPCKLEDAWNTTWTVARCLYDAYAEGQGDDKILDVDMQEMEDNWQEYQPEHN